MNDDNITGRLLGNLEKRDWYLIGAGTVLAIISGIIGQYYTVSMATGVFIDQVSVVPILIGLVFIYLARSEWSGDIARTLELIGIGLAIHMIVFIPHLNWHISGATLTDLPPLMGVPASFWYVFFHGLTLTGFALIGYGFYLLTENI